MYLVMKKEVLRLIEEDIEYQNSKLQNDYEKDKSIHWRVTGMELLKRKVEEL